MPIFHFNVASHGPEDDHEGTELPDATAARKEAVIFAGAYLRDNPDLIWDGKEFQVEVTDADHHALFVVVMITVDTSAGRTATGL